MTTNYDIVEDFFDFVATMDADKEIDHESRGDENPWCNCAVGEFFAERKGFRLERASTFTGAEHHGLLSELEEGFEVLHELLNHHYPKTYGQLDVIIKDMQKGLGKDFESELLEDYHHVVATHGWVVS